MYLLCECIRRYLRGTSPRDSITPYYDDLAHLNVPKHTHGTHSKTTAAKKLALHDGLSTWNPQEQFRMGLLWGKVVIK